MKLSEFLKDKKQSNLEIASTEITYTEGGEKIAILTLATPLPHVTGSQTIEVEGVVERVEEWDVTTVKVHQNDQDDEGFDFNEDGSGTYKGDLRLDVAKSTGEVWLRAETFAASARAMRNENQAKRNGGSVSRIQQRRAAAAAKAGEGQSRVQPVS